MGLYHIKHPAKIEGTIHKPGAEPVEFDDKAVKPLVKSGALVPHVEKKAAAGDDEIAELLKIEVIADLAKTAAKLDNKTLGKALAQARKDGKAKEWIAVIEAEFKKRNGGK